MKQHVTEDREHGLEITISYVLITGVVVSFILEVSGIVLYYIHNGNLKISQTVAAFIHGGNFFSFLINDLNLHRTGGISIVLMTGGLAVLMLTPFVRVLLSVFYFGRVKNLKYVWITLFVLVVLTISLALH